MGRAIWSGMLIPNPGDLSFQPIHSRKLTWKPKKVPINTGVLLKEDDMGFHVSLGECTNLARIKIKKSKPQSLKQPLKQGFVMPATCV